MAHGCTAAGNDQVRFEVALRTVNPGLEVLAPVRDQSFVRSEQVKYLEAISQTLSTQNLRNIILAVIRLLGMA